MLRRIWLIGKHTYLGYLRNASTQQAAAITYYLLFSLIPLAIVIVAVLGIFLSGDDVRDQIVDWVLDVIPLSETEGRDAVVNIVESIQDISTTFALFGLALSLWSSLAVFSSVRRALNNVWHMNEVRPFIMSKLIDLMQVGIVFVVLLGSIALTAIMRVAREVSADNLGPLFADSLAWEGVSAGVAGVLSFVAFCLLYKYVPAAHPRWRAVIPGAALAALLFEGLKHGFAIYVSNFTNFNVVYGSLTSVILILVFAFTSSNILLIGGEFVKTLEMYQAGAFEAEADARMPRPSLRDLIRRGSRGLFVKD